MPQLTDAFAVLWPRGERTAPSQPLAPRMSTLEGKTVAFLWDYLFRGEEIFPMLQQALSERYPGMRFIGYEDFGSTHGDEEQKILAELPARLKVLRADAVISGMGC